jgi:hypothetical protein
MVNKKAVIEHIASTTQNSISEIERAVNVEYWKDIIDFTSSRGVDVYANYLRNQGIKKIKGISRLSVEVPISRFQNSSSEKQMVTFCIEGIYAAQFRDKYKGEFDFI